MADPLYELKNVALKTFFTDVTARRDEYVSVLEEIYDENFTDRDKRITKYCRLLNQDYSDFPSEVVLPFGGNFTVECYDIRERVTLASIQEEVLKVLDEKKVQVYVKYIISNLNQVVKKVGGLNLENTLLAYRDAVVEKLQACILHLRETYLNVEQSEVSITPKIQWLGKTNVLATLIYDLWKGQEKGKQQTTQSYLKAQKKDLVALLLNNFIDSEGKPLNPDTVDDYLNSSKPQKRAKQGVRIELS